MKDLYKYIREDGFTAPGNVTGMGNPTPPTDSTLGSEPICTTCTPEKKKKKKKPTVDESIFDTLDDKGEVKKEISKETAMEVEKYKIAEWICKNHTQIVSKANRVYSSKPIGMKKKIKPEDVRKCLKYVDSLKGFVFDRSENVDFHIDILTFDITNISRRQEDIQILNNIKHVKDANFNIYTEDTVLDLSLFPNIVECNPIGGDIKIIAPRIKKIININDGPQYVEECIIIDAENLKEFDWDPSCECEELHVEYCENLSTFKHCASCRSITLPSTYVKRLLSKEPGFCFSQPDNISIEYIFE